MDRVQLQAACLDSFMRVTNAATFQKIQGIFLVDWDDLDDWDDFEASLFPYSSSFAGGSGKMVCSDGMDFEEFSFWAADIWGVALRVGSFAHRANPLLGLRKGAFADGVVGWFAVVRGDLDCRTSRQGQKESGK